MDLNYTFSLLSRSHRRLSDIFKKGKRHFRKTLRGRADDQESSSSASTSSSSPLLPATTTPTMAERKSLPTLLPYPSLLPPGVSTVGASGEGGEEGNIKDRIQQWIRQQAAGFLDKWAGPSSSNPSHQVVTRLNEAAQSLDPKSSTCLASLTVSYSDPLSSARY